MRITKNKPRGLAATLVLGLSASATVLALGGCAWIPWFGKSGAGNSVSGAATQPVADSIAVPSFRVDPNWPKPLPNNWILGQVSGIATDASDHVWVLQRPGSLTEDERGATLNPPQFACCAPAPPVLEFDAAGNLLNSWGGPGKGYNWPQSEHGIHVDGKGFVWITGNGKNDGQVLKFTRDGKFVLQIGKVGPQTGNADTTRLGQPAGVEVDTAANEVYVADGYYNKRVIVFDADTGAYKRHWGAFGKPPSSDPPELRRTAPPTVAQLMQFGNPVHCVRVAHDGLVYVCDRLNNRVQVFQKNGRYVKEFSVAPRTAGNGAVWDIVLSRDPQQRYLFMADGGNNQVLTLLRETGAVQGTTGRPGRYAGEFHWVHDLAIDSQGNLYAGEVDTGKRAQRFVRQP
jgi:DNA-binding beta-propeller fold protein YncE